MAGGMDFLLSLNEKVFTSGLDRAQTALQSLDQQLAKENDALGKMEAKAKEASDALSKIKVKPAGIDELERKLELANLKARQLFEAGDMKGWGSAAKESAQIQGKLNAAREKHGAIVAKQEGKVAQLFGDVGKQRASRDAIQQAIPAWQKWAGSIGLNKEKLGEFADQASQVGGPIGSLAGKAKGLIQMLGKGGVVGVVLLVAAAVVAMAGAAVIATVALSLYALKAADAARSSRLLSDAAAGSAARGEELEKVFSQLGSKIPQSRDKIAEWGRELEKAEIRGRDMQRTLTAMGIVAAAVGDGGASKIQQIAEASRMAGRLILGARDRFGQFASLAGTGIKAADIYAALAKSMRISIGEAKRRIDQGVVTVKQGLEALETAAETKFGPIVARQMISLEVQGRKLKENLAALFSGVNVEKFLAGLKEITDLFDQNRVMGYVLREVFSKIFTALFDSGSMVLPYIKAALMGVAFGVILVATWVKRAASWLSDAFGGKSANQAERLKTVFALGAAAVGFLFGGIVALTLALVALGTAALLLTMPLWLPFVLAAVAVYLLYKAVTGVVEGITGAFDALANLDLKAAGAKLIEDFIGGIKSKIAAVGDAVSSITDAVKGAFTGEMEIHSPSKVMARYADDTADGFTNQLVKRAPDAEDAIVGLGAAKPGQSGSGAASAQPIQFNNCSFNGSAEDNARAIREQLQAFFMSQAGAV